MKVKMSKTCVRWLQQQDELWKLCFNVNYSIRHLQNAMQTFFKVSHKYQNMNKTMEGPSYEDLMAALLSFYIDFTYSAVRKNEDFDMSPLSSTIFLTLGYSTEHIVDAFLQLDPEPSRKWTVLSPIIRKLIPMKSEIVTPKRYIKTMILVRKWFKSAPTMKNRREIKNLVQHLKPPLKLKKWLISLGLRKLIKLNALKKKKKSLTFHMLTTFPEASCQTLLDALTDSYEVGTPEENGTIKTVESLDLPEITENGSLFFLDTLANVDVINDVDRENTTDENNAPQNTETFNCSYEDLLMNISSLEVESETKEIRNIVDSGDDFDLGEENNYGFELSRDVIPSVDISANICCTSEAGDKTQDPNSKISCLNSSQADDKIQDSNSKISSLNSSHADDKTQDPNSKISCLNSSHADDKTQDPNSKISCLNSSQADDKTQDPNSKISCLNSSQADDKTQDPNSKISCLNSSQADDKMQAANSIISSDEIRPYKHIFQLRSRSNQNTREKSNKQKLVSPITLKKSNLGNKSESYEKNVSDIQKLKLNQCMISSDEIRPYKHIFQLRSRSNQNTIIEKSNKQKLVSPVTLKKSNLGNKSESYEKNVSDIQKLKLNQVKDSVNDLNCSDAMQISDLSSNNLEEKMQLTQQKKSISAPLKNLEKSVPKLTDLSVNLCHLDESLINNYSLSASTDGNQMEILPEVNVSQTRKKSLSLKKDSNLRNKKNNSTASQSVNSNNDVQLNSYFLRESSQNRKIPGTPSVKENLPSATKKESESRSSNNISKKQSTRLSSKKQNDKEIIQERGGVVSPKESSDTDAFQNAPKHKLDEPKKSDASRRRSSFLKRKSQSSELEKETSTHSPRKKSKSPITDGSPSNYNLRKSYNLRHRRKK